MGEEPRTDFDNTDGSMFYMDYPAFPEIIPCLSSSSSSSFSSAACWDLLKSDTEEDHVVNNINVDCMDVMETFEGMDLMEGGSDMWDDHDAMFSDHQNSSDFQHNHQQVVPEQQQQPYAESQVTGESSKDLAEVFLEWLKSNKESISAEDLRKIKLKRTTIESAIQRFGGGKEGMKKLLKLILEWVQNHHLQRIRTPDKPSHLQTPPNPAYHPNFIGQNGNNLIVRSPSDQNPSFSITNWNVPHHTVPQQFSPHGGNSAAMAMGTGFSTMVGYSSESMIDFNNPYQHTTDYSWSASQYAMPSPTKEARRTRMARQKRVLPHHKHSQSHHGHHQQIDRHNQLENYQHATPIITSRGNSVNSPVIASQDDPANWVYWS